MECPRDSGAEPFTLDIQQAGSYQYTSHARLSCQLSNDRITAEIFRMCVAPGQRIIDVGCGDGTYTAELLKLSPRAILGIDACREAICVAEERFAATPNVKVEYCSVYDLTPARYGSFDIAILRGLLHHLSDPLTAIANVCRLAPQIVIVEPNGYNPVLKAIEKLSRYHLKHREKSYFPSTLDRWCRAVGTRMEERSFIGLVPFFCPDWVALLLKKLEPLVESLPMVRRICCGQYVVRLGTDKPS